MIVTVTGKLGSGKSTVAKQIAEQGFHLIEPDILAHTLLTTEAIKAKVVATFGQKILHSGEISRKRLGDIVFADDASLLQLNAIVHPDLKKLIKKKIKKRVVNIIDAALFFELELDKISDFVILVTCPKPIVYRRLISKYTVETIDNIYKQQQSPEKYDVNLSSTDPTLQDKIKKIVKKIHANSNLSRNF